MQIVALITGVSTLFLQFYFVGQKLLYVMVKSNMKITMIALVPNSKALLILQRCAALMNY